MAASKAFLKELRRKHGLGEFSKKKGRVSPPALKSATPGKSPDAKNFQGFPPFNDDVFNDPDEL